MQFFYWVNICFSIFFYVLMTKFISCVDNHLNEQESTDSIEYQQISKTVHNVAINIDLFIDMLVKAIRSGSKNIDPINLPDVTERFNEKIWFVNVDGQFLMRNGNLWNLKTITRKGNSTLHFDDLKLYIDTTFTFDRLNFEYDFVSQIVSIGPNGFLSGNAKHLVFETVFTYDVRKNNIALYNISLTDKDPVEVAVQVSVIIDWLANPIINWLSNLYEDKILSTIQDVLKKVIEKNLPSKKLLLSNSEHSV